MVKRTFNQVNSNTALKYASQTIMFESFTALMFHVNAKLIKFVKQHLVANNMV